MSSIELVITPPQLEIVVMPGNDVIEVLDMATDIEVLAPEFTPEPVIEVDTGLPGPPGAPGTIVAVSVLPPDSPSINDLWVPIPS